MENEKNETITAEAIERIEIAFEFPLKTDEDYQEIGEIFDEDE